MINKEVSNNSEWLKILIAIPYSQGSANMYHVNSIVYYLLEGLTKMLMSEFSLELSVECANQAIRHFP